MGWTSYNARYYKNGKIDRKREMDSYFIEGLNEGFYEIVKSAMVGSVYYAAIRQLMRCVKADNERGYDRVAIPENEQRVHGVVMLTQVDMSDYYNIAYKDISEDMGPYESKCPVSIIKALSPTTNENALAWRQRCIDYAKTKGVRNLPIGTIIEFEKYDGATVRLIKCAPQYQFKTAWWKFVNERKYFHKKDIPWDRVRIIENI